MLQQTRVSAALPYYERFLAALPDIPALAGLRRGKAAQALGGSWLTTAGCATCKRLHASSCEQYGGQLPADYDALRALPGIGDYTAGAVASISFGIPVPAVDGNVLRVFSRLYNDPAAVTEPAVKKAFTARVMEHQPPDAPGDYNQALMELGAAGLRAAERCAPVRKMPACPPVRRPCCGHCIGAAPQSSAQAPADCSL